MTRGYPRDHSLIQIFVLGNDGFDSETRNRNLTTASAESFSFAIIVDHSQRGSRHPIYISNIE